MDEPCQHCGSNHDPLFVTMCRDRVVAERDRWRRLAGELAAALKARCDYDSDDDALITRCREAGLL